MNWLLQSLGCFVCSGIILSCVPKDPKGSSGSTGDEILEEPPLSRFRPRPHARPVGRALSSEGRLPGDAAPGIESPLLTAVFRDDFERNTLGENWLKTTPRWGIRHGQLCVQEARNHPVWLNRRLPTNARITFKAKSESNDGDIKVEAWGSGRSFAHGISYNDATSYLFIYGGWKNQMHVLARLNEHAASRLARRVEEDASNTVNGRVEPGRSYRFDIERKDGKIVSWYVDGTLLFRLEDDAPLSGPSHDHFGFNDWDTSVCFDDLVITPLAE